MSIVILGIAWLAGIWLASILNWHTNSWLILTGFGLISGLFLRGQPRFRLFLFAAALCGLGAARYNTTVPTIDSNHIAYYNRSVNIILTGIVIDEPDIRDQRINLRVDADAIAFPDGASQPVEGTLLVRVPRFPVIPYGARVQLQGKLETPPTDGDFNYKDYLARQGVHSLMSRPQIQVLSTGHGNPIYHAIYAIKARAQATINSLLPNPQSALLSGILLGNDNGMPVDLAEDFRATGMTHIIAISGFNIAILIAILVALGEPFFSRRGAVLFAMTGIILYTILVGADASVVRAAIMGGIFLIASRLLGRPNFAFASLFLAAFIMTLVNPYTLWDVGFLLSFTATLGLMLYATPITDWTQARLQNHLDKERMRQVMGVLSEAVLLTIAAQILTLPLMVSTFGQLSLISLPANALILPAQPGVMTWGGLATLTGMVFEPLGQILAWVAWLFLTYTIALVEFFARVPGAVVEVEMSTAVLILTYLLIGAATWWMFQSTQQRQAIIESGRQHFSQRIAFSGSLIALLLVGGWSFSQPDGSLHVTFFDVGQGDAIFIQTPSGRQILVDGGYYPSILNAHMGDVMPFWDRELDLVVATHPDADHTAGLAGVFDRYRVGQLFTEGTDAGESDIFDAVLFAAEAQNVPVHIAQAGEVVDFGDGVRLEVVHPGAERDLENRNENSVSLRLVYADFSLLLTGDVETEGEKEMLAEKRPLQSLIFKAGHHGSNTSSTAPFLAVVQPQIIIVSAGKDNKFGHPHPDLLQRARDIGAIVLRTDEMGTLEVISDGKEMWWQTHP